MSHIPQEIEPAPSTGEIFFRISDGSGQSIPDVQITQPEKIRRGSLGFRKLMDAERTSQQILLQLDRDSGIDGHLVAWVLENMQREALAVQPEQETLARLCAVLWKYECIPDPFKNLADSMQPRSSSGSPSIDQQSSVSPSASPSAGSRRWGRRKNNSTCSRLITIAVVLGHQEVLEEEIKSAIWDTDRKVEIDISLGIDIEARRKVELGELFDNVYGDIFAIKNDNERLVKSIWEILKYHKLGDFSKSWRVNAKELEKWKNWTPYDFLRGIENALGPEPEVQHPAAQGHKGSRGKDPPQVHWGNIARKTTNAVKKTLHIIEGEEVGSEQKKMDDILESLEQLIHTRRHTLAAELMARRDLIVKGWKDKLVELG